MQYERWWGCGAINVVARPNNIHRDDDYGHDDYSPSLKRKQQSVSFFYCCAFGCCEIDCGVFLLLFVAMFSCFCLCFIIVFLFAFELINVLCSC